MCINLNFLSKIIYIININLTFLIIILPKLTKVKAIYLHNLFL